MWQHRKRGCGQSIVKHEQRIIWNIYNQHWTTHMIQDQLIAIIFLITIGIIIY